MTPAPLRIALIGCGDHARQQHAAPLARWAKENPGKIALAAACDPIQQRAIEVCEQFGFAQSFTDMQQMLDRISPDACVSVPPVHLNASIGIELLQRRIPCVIEKPPGTSMQEVNQLAEVAKQTRTPHMISMNRRFNPHLNAAVQKFRSIGPLRQIIATMFRVNRRESEFVWATGIHAIDAVRYLGGEFRELSHRTTGRKYHIEGKFKSGAFALIDIQPEAAFFHEYYDLLGESHSCNIRIHESGQVQSAIYRDGDAISWYTSDEKEPTDIRCGAYAETDHFITSLLSGTPLQPTIHDVAPSAQIAFSVQALSS